MLKIKLKWDFDWQYVHANLRKIHKRVWLLEWSQASVSHASSSDAHTDIKAMIAGSWNIGMYNHSLECR